MSLSVRKVMEGGTDLIGAHVLYRPSCASTDRFLMERLQHMILPEGTVAVTDHQYAGRGQGSNVWYVPPYQNLTLSLVLYPDPTQPKLPVALGLCIGLAVRACLAAHLNPAPTLKWPNDLYYGHRKIGGLLIHCLAQSQRPGAVVVGIGVNVNQTTFVDPSWTSMAKACQHNFSLTKLYKQLLQALEMHYKKFRETPFEDFKHRYTQCMYGLQKPHLFQAGSNRFRGVIAGLDVFGRLCVQHPCGKMKSYHTREIQFIRPLAQT